MRSIKIMALGTALAVSGFAPAFAQAPGEEALQQYCSSDYMRLCAQYDPDSPQVEQCFKAKMKELSPECRSAISAWQKKNPSGRRH